MAGEVATRVGPAPLTAPATDEPATRVGPLQAPSKPKLPVPSQPNLRAAPAPAPSPSRPKVPVAVAEAATRAPSVPRVATMIGGGLVAPPSPPPSPRPSMSGADQPLTRRCTSCNELYPKDFLVCPRDATPLADESAEGDAVDPLVGKLIGETYQIVRVVGEGGMGRVYEARHLRLKERRFAVKTLHSDLAKNAEMAARFLREAESASSLSHPNVVDVFDVHHLPDGTPYLVGEFLEGEELADHVRTHGPLDPMQVANVGRQIANALGAAHARGIVHRDMKPENVFVLRSGSDKRALSVKVLDFGISMAGDSGGAHLTRTGVIMGTPSYMSPEQARGQKVDHRADVYSTGAVLYYAVTGRRPFDSDDPTSTLSMVLTQDPVRPREIDPRIPEVFELVIQKAMAKDAGDRFQTMAELEKALASIGAPSPGEMMLRPGVSSAPPAEKVDPKSTSAREAFNLARAMFNPSTPSPQQSGALAKTARPTIVLTSAALGAWAVGGLTAMLAGLVRFLHEGEVTLTESVLLVVGCIFAAATPVALYVLHVKKTIWPNTVRALQLATDLKRTTTAALVTYGALCVASRVILTVFVRNSKSLGSGIWDIVLFLVSVLAAVLLGGVGPLVRNLRRRRSG